MKSLKLLAALAAVTAVPASAGTLAFSGTFINTNPPAAPGGRCPVLTVSIANLGGPLYATGTSTLGDFTATQSHCLDAGPPLAVGASPTPYYDGLFTYSFAGGASLFGTYTGLLTNSGVAGIVDNVQTFIVTGGTGRLSNASGSFLGTGSIRFAGGPPSASLTIGTSVLAVPEPATWGMMTVGFTAAGLAIRSRRPVRPAARA